MPKFKPGEIVLYREDTNVKLGVIKDCVIVTQSLIASTSKETAYYVYYDTDDTTVLTEEKNLSKVRNTYAFLILRRKANVINIDDTPARQLSSDILDALNSMVILKYGEPLFYDHSEVDNDGEPITEGLISGAYYDCEDLLTNLINEYKNK